MKRLLVITGWFVSTSMALIAATYTFSLVYLKNVSLVPAFAKLISQEKEPSSLYAYADIHGNVKGINTSVETADARPIIIEEFLKNFNSPLKPYDHFGQFLTNLADEYNMDYRLLPSIAMQESNLCKTIPDNSYNCLGLGVHSQGTWRFKSYEDNFRAAAKILREKYLDQGLITPEEIQDKYTPQSNGSWEFSVNHFMEVLEYADF